MASFFEHIGTDVQDVAEADALAAQAAAELAQAAAETAKTSAESSASNAATSAANAATSETNAAASATSIQNLNTATGAAGSNVSFDGSSNTITVPRGDTGATGPQGPAGQDGQDGADSTVAGPQGPQGPQGIQGIQGPAGQDGADSTVAGPQGPAGQDGADSTVAGPQGPQGIQGIQGPAGADGADGTTFDTNVLTVDGTNNRIGVNDTTPSVSIDAGSNTDALHVPVGTTAQRPTGAAGRFRYNSSLAQFEGYTDAWGAIGGGAVSGSNLNIDSMTGDGSDTTLTLSIAPINENNTQVFVDGVYQSKANYSISGTTLTFSTAPPNGSAVEVMTMTQTDINVPVDGTITSAKLSGDLVTPGALDVTGTVTADGLTVDTSDQVIINHSADGGGIRIDSTNATNTGSLRFGDVADNYIGAVEYNHTNDSMSFYVNNATRMTIDSSGSVGVGVSNPDGTLHVHTASAGTVAASSQADDLVVENNAETGITIISPDDQSARIRFTSPSTNNDVGGATIFYRQNINKMLVGTAVSGGKLALASGAGNETILLDGSGNVAIGSSSATARLEVTGAFGYASGANSLATTVSKAAARIRGSSDASTSLFFGSLTNDAEQYIQSSNGAGSAADDIALNPYGGNVGIGRIPRVMLDVAGEVAITHNATYGLRFYNQPQNNWSSIGNPETSSSAVLVFKAASGEGMRLDGNSNLLVGKTTTAIATAGTFIGVGGNVGLVEITRDGNHPLRLNRKSSDGVILRFDKDGTQVGTISTNANSLPSDRNFKKNIQDLQLGLNFVSSLNPVTYNYKIDDDDAPVMAGLIAQDVEAALASAGVEANSMTLLQHKPTEDDKESNYQMDYLKLVPVLINAIQELTERISQLENN